MKAQPVDWWGQAVEAESRVRLARATCAWWQREQRCLQVAHWGAGAFIILGLVLGLWLWVSNWHLAGEALANARAQEQTAIVKRQQWERRLCEQSAECIGEKMRRAAATRDKGLVVDSLAPKKISPKKIGKGNP